MNEEDLETVPNRKPPQQMLLECGMCDKPVIAVPRGYIIDNNDGEPGSNTPFYRWALLQCEKRHPILILQIDWNDDPSEWHWDEPLLAYPPQDRELSISIPEQLRQAHGEARACYRAKAYTAAAVMCGRTLEATCALNEIRERTLQQSLAKMKDQGHIDGRLWEWAETLRSVRNAAAHYN